MCEVGYSSCFVCMPNLRTWHLKVTNFLLSTLHAHTCSRGKVIGLSVDICMYVYNVQKKSLNGTFQEDVCCEALVWGCLFNL